MRPSAVLPAVAAIALSSTLLPTHRDTAAIIADAAAPAAAHISDVDAFADIAAIIPPDRRIDWTHDTGVPGGIPEWTRVCATIDAAAYGAGDTDATRAIQAAVDGCATSAPGTEPGPGVVVVPAGTYRLDGSVNIKRSHLVIRGAGADKTTFLAGGQAFSIGGNGLAFKNIAITAGAMKGSTEITLADVAAVADLAVGQLIDISADNEPGLVFASHNSNHDAKQMALITTIRGTTLTITPPLLWSYAPNPVVLYSFIGITRFVGLEDMKVDHVNGRSGASFMIDQCYGCWVRGIASYKPGGYHTYILDSLRGEIRDSYFLDSQTYGANNAGLNVRGTTNGGVNQGAVTGFAFENNIFDKTFPGVELQNASSGNYVGFNYGYAAQAGNREPGDDYVGWNTGMFNDNHGPHDMMNLWEGNAGEQFTSDGYFGSASHGTLYRNHLTGLNPRFGIAWNAISLNRWSYHYNVVGNVLGADAVAAVTYQFGDTASCGAGKGIYRLGFPNTGNCGLTPFDGASPPGIDAAVTSTLLRWGNYDTKHGDAVWDAAEIPAGVPAPTTRQLPASLYYDRKPPWWPPAVAWPPIGPDVTDGELVAGHAWKIPAQRCYEARRLGEGGAFSRAACYGQQAAPPGGRIYLPALVDGGGRSASG